jgi:hypothetical protein
VDDPKKLAPAILHAFGRAGLRLSSIDTRYEKFMQILASICRAIGLGDAGRSFEEKVRISLVAKDTKIIEQRVLDAQIEKQEHNTVPEPDNSTHHKKKL